MHRSFSCLGPSRLSFCCCCPHLAPRTQLAHGAHPHHPWGMRVLLINTLSWVSWPEVYSGAGVESQDTQEDRHRQADRERSGERAREGPARKGKTPPPSNIKRHQHINTPLAPLSNLWQTALVTSRRTRGGVAGATSSRKPETNSGVVWDPEDWVLPHPRGKRNLGSIWKGRG